MIVPQPRRPLVPSDGRARDSRGRDSGPWVRPVTAPQRELRAGATPVAPRTGAHATPRRPSSPRRKLVVGRVMRGAGLLGVAAFAALSVVGLAGLVERSDAFARVLPVRAVVVHGVDGARVDEVLAYAGVTVGVPFFSVDTAAVAARVLEHPFIAQARVRRVAPDGIEITVTSRLARAVLSQDTGLYLVDGAGHVMKSARAGDGLDLPVITGITGIEGARAASGAAHEELSAAMALVAAHEAAGSPGGPLGEVHAIAGVGFDLVLDAGEGHGARVRIGSMGRGWNDKLARLTEVLRRLDQAGRQASSINIDDDRRPERAAVRLRSDAEMRQAGGTNIPRERG